MNRFLVLLLIFCSLTLSCQRKSGQRRGNEHSPDYYVKVIKVSDGDTFTGLTEDRKSIRYRIHGIDAPEKKQAYGNKSKEKLAGLIFGQTVGITVITKSDRYNRPVVKVVTPDGLDVGAEMIRSGMAWHFVKYDNSDLYKELEISARNNTIGLWQDSQPIAPWEWRKMPKK